MFRFLFQCIKNFGLASGILIYLRIKVLKRDSVKLPGYKYPIWFRPNSADLSTFREIFLRQEYLVHLPSVIIPNIIIDAGANIGFTSLFFQRQYPNAKIFSLEPENENFDLIKKNTAGYPQITPVKSALWYKKEKIEISDKGYGVRGFVVEENNSDNSITSIPATTIVDIMAEYKISSIDILKIDIEGSEKEVFTYDFDKWLPLTKCLIIELHDRMKDGCSKAVFNAIGQFNFECSIKGENLVFINKEFLY